MSIKVQVTQDDIIQGQKCSPTTCPVALALNRVFGRVQVGSEYYIRYDADKVKWANFHQEIIDFIESFDKGREVNPIEFEIEVE